MILRTNTIIRDDNRDGVPDYREDAYIWTDESGKLEYQIKNIDNGADGVDVRYVTDPAYDEAGNKFRESFARDYGADGAVEESWAVSYGYSPDGTVAWESDGTSHTNYNPDGTIAWESDGTSHTNYAYREDGALVWQRMDGPDQDGDGLADYSYITDNEYNGSGQITSTHYYSLFNGYLDAVTDRTDTYTYNGKGLLTEYRIDNPHYEVETAWHYKYNSAGQVTQVKHEDPFIYGDERPRNSETYKYNKDGSLKESNRYDEYMNGQQVLEDKGKFYYDDGLLVKEVHTGQNGNWQTITGWQDEFWYNDLNQKTHQLTSFDVDGDGVYEAGTRTLQSWAYNPDGSVGYYELDANTGDGIAEMQEFSQLIA